MSSFVFALAEASGTLRSRRIAEVGTAARGDELLRGGKAEPLPLAQGRMAHEELELMNLER